MRYVTCGASTQSRATRPGRKVEVAYCSGTREVCVDMRQILSWPLGQHGALLGYPSLYNPYTRELVEKLTGYMNRGVASCGAYPPECEEQLAEMLVKRYAPYMTSADIGVRLFSNGTDANQCAVALSRFATGRDRIISIGYHGGSSPVFNSPPQNGGVLRANDLYADNVDFDRIDEFTLPSSYFACVVVEVPPVRDEVDAFLKLKSLRQYCDNGDTHLILDEVVTGFRYGPSGALGAYSNAALADFVVLGKAMSTFGKVSALLGPRDIMNRLGDRVFASFTYNDHPLGILDAIETIATYDQLGNMLYRHIMDIGTSLMDGLNKVFLRRGFECEVYGHPPRTTIESKMKLELYWEFLSRLVDEHDVLIHRPQFATMAHTQEDVSRTIEAVDKTLASMGFELQ